MSLTTRNRTVRLLTLLFTVLTFAPGAAVTESFVVESCVRSHGYWKNHVPQWPVVSIVLGDPAFAGHTYQQQALIGLLSGPAKGDASVILAMQLIAAKLNVANGASAQPIAGWLTRADALLAAFRQRLPYGLKTDTPIGSDMVVVASVLEQFNVGTIAGSCGPANTAPVANAGPPQSVPVGFTVTLDGSNSSDADGQALAFRWTFVSKPTTSAAVLSDPAAVRPTFVPDVAGDYDVRLIVSDGSLDSAPSAVRISTINSQPSANAGLDQTAPVGATVSLSGAASTDPDGDSLTFAWSIAERPGGSSAALINPQAVSPSLTIDQPGQYRIELVVFDGALLSPPDSVTISTINSPPVARAGADSATTVGSEVTLDGSASTDVDGDALTYRWTLTSTPASSTTTLTNATAVNPSFVPDLAGDYVVELIVNDGAADSAPDVVIVNTSRGNTAPVAYAGLNQSAITGDVVQLDGSGSTDINGDPLTFAWSFTSVPAGSAAGFADPAAVKPTFTPDVSGDYIAQLIVSDPSTASAPSTVTINVQPRPPDNQAPVAEAGVSQTVPLNSVAVFDGSGSSDPDGDPLTFAWSLLSRPAGSAAVLSDPTTAAPSLAVDAHGTYVAQLIVNDGTVNSEPDTVSISTQNSAPVADAGDDASVARGTTVQLDGSASLDPDGSPLTLSWALTTRPAGSAATLSDPAAANPTFVADIAGTYVAQLIVSDGLLTSAPDTITVTATQGTDLRVTVNAPAAPAIGSSASWLVELHNLGPIDASNIRVHAALPAGYTFTGVNTFGFGSYDTATNIWTLDTVANSAGAFVFISFTVNATGPHDLQASIIGSSVPDPVSTNNTATLSVTPNPRADLRMSFFGSTGNHRPGDELFFLVDVFNAGPARVTNVAAEFRLPDGMTLLSADPNNILPTTYDAVTGAWTIGTVNNGVVARLVLRARLNPLGSILLRGSITNSSGPDPDLSNNVVTPARLNRPPVALAGADRAVSTHVAVTLDGSASFDADGDPITYQWTPTLRPINSGTLLSTPTEPSLSMTPDLPGNYRAQLVVRDSFGVVSDADSVLVTAVTTNHPPVFVTTPPRSASTGQPYAHNADANDPDAGEVLTFSLPIAPAGMTIDGSTGVVNWTPAPDQAGQHNVVVRVQDAGGLFATQAIALQVSSAGNGAPLAVDDSYTVRVSESLSVGAPGVTVNDIDETALTARLVSAPGNGVAILNADGSFTYTPHSLQPGEFVMAENVNLAARMPGVTEVRLDVNCPRCAIDENLLTNWVSGGAALEIVFPAAVTVDRVVVVGDRNPHAHKISAGIFELIAGDGTVLYGSGPVEILGPRFDATLNLPSLQGVRRVRFTPTASPTFLFAASLAELKVIGSGLIRRERFVEPNLVQLLPAAAQSNSVFGPHTPEGVIDDSVGSNWFSNGNVGDFIEVTLPRDVTVTELVTANPNGRPDGFGTSLGISCSGRFVFLDAGRNQLFDSGLVNEPSGGMHFGDTFTLSVPSLTNVRHVRYTLASCTGSFPAGFSDWRLIGTTDLDTPAFSMVKKFQSLIGREAHSTPIVVNLTDDNGDGAVNADDTPDILVPVEATDDQRRGDIKAISGADGTELFTAGAGIVSPWSELAAGDIDLDGLPEIIAVHPGGDNLVAFEHTGALKWTSDANRMPMFFIGETALVGGAVSIANLDGAGAPEIIVGASVFDNTGRLIGDGRTLGGTTGGAGLRSAISSVADIDLDGTPELVAGPTAYRLVNGQLSVVWRRSDRPDGYVAIANLDDDPQAEIVIVANGVVYTLNHDGSDYQDWNAPDHTPIAIPGGGQGGAPLIVDVDGNGAVEIGVAGAGNFVLFNGDGSVRWKSAISDRSSNSTGAVAFDLNGDGEVEIIYRDEFFLRIYRGSDGVLLARTPVGSATWAEEPVVADVDNDGHADIIVSSDFFQQRQDDTGIIVFQDVANKWKRTRRIWNQHAYHVTNVNEDATIPVSETAHWLVGGLNSFRTNAFVPGESTDETDSFTYVASDGVLESNTATVRIAIRTPNSGPQITSTPVTAAADGVSYAYAAAASDPDAGDILTFSMPAAPAGLSIDPASGLVTWTPTAAQRGTHPVVIKVADVRGLHALQSYQLTVAAALTVPDVVGQIQAAAQSAITAASLAIGAVTTRHASGAPQGSVVSQSPAGGSSAAAGTLVSLVVSLGPPPVGTVPSVVGLAQTAAQQDVIAAGFSSTAAFQNNSVVPAGVVIGQTPAGGTIAPSTTVVSLVVSLGPPPGELDLDLDGFTGNQGDCNDTNAAINPAAIDIAGDGIDQNCNGVDSIAGDSTFPIANIESPAEDAEITMPTDIVGTATDANFLRYHLQLAPADETVYSTIASGATPVNGGVLGRVDPTRLENGIYRLRLVVEDANGQASNTERAYRVRGDAKVGVLGLSWVDVRVPVTGIPIRVIRSYDNRIKSQRDFGVGWELEVKAGKYQNNRRPGDGWRVETAPGPFGLPCSITTETRTHLTELRLSDREFYLFRPRLTALAAVVGGCVGSVVYDFVDGSMPGATLTVLGNTDIIYTSGDQIAEFDGSGNTGLIFDPLEVRLTTVNGRVIDFKRGAGITRLEDDNGNTLSITDAGIAHSSGKSIAFARDAQGRITRVTEPTGAAISYSYTGGDLAEVVDQLNNKTTFTYDGQHNLLEIHDPLGNRAMRSEFDANGRLIAMIDANNQRIEFAHDLSNREEVVTDARGHSTILLYDELGHMQAQRRRVTIDGAQVVATTTFVTDARGNVLSTVDPDGLRVDAVYDHEDLTEQIIDPQGLRIRTSLTLDARREPLTIKDPVGNSMQFAYDRNGNLRTYTDPLGQSSVTAYDGSGRATAATDAAGIRRTGVYDNANNLLAEDVLDATGKVLLTQRYTYDANGNRLTATVYRTVDGASRAHTTIYTYDAKNRVIAVTDPLGHTIRTRYNAVGLVDAQVDALGRETKHTYDDVGTRIRTDYPDNTFERFAYDATGNLIAETDRAGRTMRFEYDELNRQAQIITPGKEITQTVYTPGGRIAAVIDPLGKRTDYEYDGAGRRTRTLQPSVLDAAQAAQARPEIREEYDGNGRATAVIDPNGRRTAFHWEGVERITRRDFADNNSVHATYDVLGRISERVDEAGRVTRFEYDGLGRLTRVNESAPSVADSNPVTSYAWDELGNLISATDAAGRITRFAYDPMGRVVARTLPGGGAEHFTYDAVGNVVSHTNFNGQTTTFQYDVMNRLIRKNLPDGFAATFAYTATGQRASATDRRGTTTYTYDANGRLARVNHPTGDVVTYGYDGAGRLARLESPGGVLHYEYDAIGRLSRVTGPSGATQYGFDLAGNVVKVTGANGVSSEHQFDARNRLTNIRYVRSGNTIGSFAYALSPTGRRLSMTTQDGSVETYGYDQLDRLRSEVRTGTDPRSITYGYDAVGNRTSMLRNSTPTFYTYDVNHRLVSAGATNFTYDGNGNQLTETTGGVITGYEWDSENRLIRAVGPSGTTEFGYDADGNRVGRTVNGATTRTLLETATGLPQVLEERDAAGTLLAHHTYGIRRLSTTNGTTSSFYHQDALGSTRFLTDGAGAVTDSYGYEAYGTLATQSGPTQNPYLFAGERYEASLGLYDLRARNYAPVNGRFLGLDPALPKLGDPRSAHPFIYAHVDPVNGTDPTGRSLLLELAYRFGIENIIRTADCGMKVYNGCRTIGLAQGYQTAAIIGVAGVMAGLAFDKAEQTATGDNAFGAIPQAGLVVASFDTKGGIGARINLEKVEFRIFGKSNQQGLFNGKLKPGAPPSDVKLVGAFDFTTRGPSLKIRVGYEMLAGVASFESGVNLAPNGASFTVCGFEFFSIEVAIRGNGLRGSVGLEATLLKLVKFQYPIFPPQSAQAGQ